MDTFPSGSPFNSRPISRVTGQPLSESQELSLTLYAPTKQRSIASLIKDTLSGLEQPIHLHDLGHAEVGSIAPTGQNDQMKELEEAPTLSKVDLVEKLGPHIVEFEPNDKSLATNWSSARKWLTLAVISFLALFA